MRDFLQEIQALNPNLFISSDGTRIIPKTRNTSSVHPPADLPLPPKDPLAEPADNLLILEEVVSPPQESARPSILKKAFNLLKRPVKRPFMNFSPQGSRNPSASIGTTLTPSSPRVSIDQKRSSLLLPSPAFLGNTSTSEPTSSAYDNDDDDSYSEEELLESLPCSEDLLPAGVFKQLVLSASGWLLDEPFFSWMVSCLKNQETCSLSLGHNYATGQLTTSELGALLAQIDLPILQAVTFCFQKIDMHDLYRFVSRHNMLATLDLGIHPLIDTTGDPLPSLSFLANLSTLRASTKALSMILGNVDTLPLPRLSYLYILRVESDDLLPAHDILSRVLPASGSKALIATLTLAHGIDGLIHMVLQSDNMRIQLWNCFPPTKAELLPRLPHWVSYFPQQILSVEMDFTYGQKWDLTNAELELLMREIVRARPDVQYFRAQGVKGKVDRVKD